MAMEKNKSSEMRKWVKEKCQQRSPVEGMLTARVQRGKGTACPVGGWVGPLLTQLSLPTWLYATDPWFAPKIHVILVSRFVFSLTNKG